jgi:hypothetical protein
VAGAGLAGCSTTNARGPPAHSTTQRRRRVRPWPGTTCARLLLAGWGELLLRRAQDPGGRQHPGCGGDDQRRSSTATSTASRPPTPYSDDYDDTVARNVREQRR